MQNDLHLSVIVLHYSLAALDQIVSVVQCEMRISLNDDGDSGHDDTNQDVVLFAGFS